MGTNLTKQSRVSRVLHFKDTWLLKSVLIGAYATNAICKGRSTVLLKEATQRDVERERRQRMEAEARVREATAEAERARSRIHHLQRELAR
ncbi:hypothetical protein ALC53_12936 [Atta colombica]|uniref:Uncharacterized protein n=1 Tax=Atta colombica TaxID=520822 RepID=A0A151HYG6_9HYME|nr:hypothetical protein ALC53_12936 [Atta colombica]